MTNTLRRLNYGDLPASVPDLTCFQEGSSTDVNRVTFLGSNMDQVYCDRIRLTGGQLSLERARCTWLYATALGQFTECAPGETVQGVCGGDANPCCEPGVLHGIMCCPLVIL